MASVDHRSAQGSNESMRHTSFVLLSVRHVLVSIGIVAAAGCNDAAPPKEQLHAAKVETQAAFSQGLLLHYGFYADQALTAFEEAATADPSDPAPRLGIALALGPRTNDPDMTMRMERAFKEAQAAIALSSNRPGLIQDLSSAVAVRYTQAATFDAKTMNRAYADAVRVVASKYPDNDDVATLYAESLALVADHPWWNADGTPKAEIAAGIAMLEPVLARHPSHIGANHYYIHFIEGTSYPERALPSAKRLETLAPDVGHLLHMPSHIYMRTGDYRGAVAVNQKAAGADRPGAVHGHHGGVGVEGTLVAHTREYLASAAAMTGQSAVALDADGSLFPRLRFRRWDEILAYPKVDGGVGELEWRAAQAIALTATHRLAEARAQRHAFSSHARTLPANATWWSDPLTAFLPLAEAEMDARLAWAEGDRRTSIQLWQQAVTAQDRLSRTEAVMSWYHAVRESLGAALLLVANPADAEQVFRADLRVNPKNPRSLFGLWQALEAQKRQDEAQHVKGEFDMAWRDADIELRLDEF